MFRLSTLLFIIGCCMLSTLALAQKGEYTNSANPKSEKRDANAQSAKQRVDEARLLHWMAFQGNQLQVEQLIEAGADVNRLIAKGGTPLHLAALSGHVEIVLLLIQHGADVNARTDGGATPLDWAADNGHSEVVKRLVEHGATHGKKRPGEPRLSSDADAPKAESLSQTNETDSVERGGTLSLTPLHEAKPGNAQRSSDKSAGEGQNGSARKKLRVDPRLQRALVNYRRSQREKADVSPAALSENLAEAGEKRPDEGSARLQLGSFRNKQRALQARDLFAKRYRDILGESSLNLSRASAKGKVYHRVHSGHMTLKMAKSLCQELRDRSYPCLVVRH